MISDAPFFSDWRPNHTCDVDGWRWAEYAACRGTDPEVWFDKSTTTYRYLSNICSQCPVRINCLDRALRDEAWGFWAGTTENQRRHMLGHVTDRNGKRLPASVTVDA
jgi:WhiB family redox-sensing transcriptional regulator